MFPGQLVAPSLYFFPGDPLATIEARNRAARLGIEGSPTFLADGVVRTMGSTGCTQSIEDYSGDIEQRLLATGGASPVQITGSVAVDGELVHVTAHYVLVDGGHSYTSHQATLFLYEDSLHWCCGNGGDSLWNGITRMVRSSPLSLTRVGEVKTVTQTLNTAGFSVPVDVAHLHPLAVFEEVSGAMTVIEASDLTVPDYALTFPLRVAALPAGNGTGYFQGTVTNLAQSDDVIHLALDTGFGWPADFRLPGDPNWYQSRDVSFVAGQAQTITVRVQTDGVRRIGAGRLTAQSQTTGRISSVSLRLFNEAQAILLVNADNDEGYGSEFTRVLDGLGYLYDTMGHAAALDQMRGYNCVLWQTGYANPAMTGQQKDNLSAYLDGGGTLFLSGMGALAGALSDDLFLHSYAGVASWQMDTGAVRALGTPGDPISDGMDMALTWPVPQDNLVGTLNPADGASVVFTSESGAPAALRYQGIPFRTVLSTICQDALPATGDDPDNSQSVIARTLAWLLAFDPTAVPAAPAWAPALVLSAGPNPAREYTVLRYLLGPDNTSFASITILDAGGRALRTIRGKGLHPGLQRTVWDCTDGSGRRVPAGFYFARLSTSKGAAGARLVVLP